MRYFNDNMSSGVSEVFRAMRIIEDFMAKLRNPDTSQNYIDELNERLKTDYKALRDKGWLQSEVEDLNWYMSREAEEYEPRAEKIRELQKEYDETTQRYFEYYLIYVEKVEPVKKPYTEALAKVQALDDRLMELNSAKNRDKAAIEEVSKEREEAAYIADKRKKAYDEYAEFDKELTSSKRRMDDLFSQIDKLKLEINDEAGDYEKNAAQAEFYNGIINDYDNRIREIYEDALYCVEMIEKLDGKPRYSSLDVKKRASEIGIAPDPFFG